MQSRAGQQPSLFEQVSLFDGKHLEDVIVEKLRARPEFKAFHSDLLKDLKLSPSEYFVYWTAVGRLVNEGVVIRTRGKGGSVRLVEQGAEPERASAKEKQKHRRPEAELYVPVATTLRDWWVPQEANLRESIVEITAHQGRRQTGGFWTRPDITVLGIVAHPYLPGRDLSISTFEIKKSIDEGIQGIYETAAHQAFAHQSFLLINVLADESINDDDAFERVKSEANRFGIGVIVFTDPSDWKTFEIITEAQFRAPNPALVNQFIANQISEDSRHRLLTMFR